MNEPSSSRPAVRYAVVGLGHIAQVAMLPAFENAAEAELVALVSGEETKRAELGQRYGVRTVDYGEYDALCASGDIDAVYIALPNHLHCEYTERAARHGVHVLVEKPMAVTEEECERMHRACEQGGAKLMVAYRLHFDAANLQAVRIAREELGELRWFDSVHSQYVAPGDIRTQNIDQGGGSLYDIGIYCINAARYLFGDEPEEVSALATMATDPEHGGTYDQTVGATLRFPGGRIASFVTSFDASRRNAYRLAGTRGDLLMDPAYGYVEPLFLHVTIDDRTRSERFPVRDQFGPQLVYFSRCIQENRQPEPDWREGLADVRIIRALHRSAREGRAVSLQAMPRPNRPDPDQAIDREPVEPPEEVGASSPSEKD